MKPAHRRQQGKSAFELVEEAIQLLRMAPAATLATYFVGALPFVLGFLYFWLDMARSPFAYQHLPGATLGVSALFLWMKFWQAIFALNLRAGLTGEPLRLNPARCWRIFITQTALQPTGLFVLPLAAVATLPFAWVFAFYQNLTVLAEGDSGDLRAALRQARQAATLWPGQNHLLLVVLGGFGVCVFLNWTTVCFLLPGLVKMLVGVESTFSRSALSMLNTTFFTAMLGLSYLCLDPIVKAVYTLRCFYGQSRRTGEDLKAELRQTAPAAQLAVACVLLLAAFATTSADGEPSASSTRAGMVPATWPEANQAALDRIFPRPPGLGEPALINTLLQQGVTGRRDLRNRFNGFARVVETVETVSVLALAPYTPLKRGVNERCQRCPQSVSGAQDIGPFRDRDNLSPLPFGRGEGQGEGSSGGDLTLAEANRAPLSAAAHPPSSQAPGISPSDLDHAIGQVIQQRKYTWRAPREKIVKPETTKTGPIARFLERVGRMLRRWLRAALDWLVEFLRKLFPRQPSPKSGASGYGWMVLLQVLLYALVAAVVVALAFLLYQTWIGRRRPSTPIAGEPILPVPDLADENVSAEQLPEDGWLKMARELLERGELRLALRAFYLSSLAHLAGRNLVSLAKFKSNRDYERELGRRGHAFPDLLARFGENVSMFDCIWYGLHAIDLDLVNRFAANVEQIKTGGTTA